MLKCYAMNMFLGLLGIWETFVFVETQTKHTNWSQNTFCTNTYIIIIHSFHFGFALCPKHIVSPIYSIAAPGPPGPILL